MITTASTTIYFDGKPLASGKIEADLAPPELDSTTLFPEHFKASFTCEGKGSIDAFVSLQPASAPAVDMTIPWGILGPIKIRGFVADSTLRGSSAGHEVSMSVEAPERDVRREISMAVQRAIATSSGQWAAASRAWQSSDKYLREMALKLFRFDQRGTVFFNHRLARYRGDRKRRRAMRRLLRAAGVTQPTERQ